MTRTIKALLFLFLAVVAVQFGCKKTKPSTLGGGTGGTNVLRITPEHAGTLIDSCTVYIKYAASDAPASGIYDDSTKVTVVDTTPVATFTGLQKGTYYVFARGYHVGYSPPFVSGGLSYKISSQDTVTGYVYLAVSY